jgi:hypothetical protein
MQIAAAICTSPPNEDLGKELLLLDFLAQIVACHPKGAAPPSASSDASLDV